MVNFLFAIIEHFFDSSYGADVIKDNGRSRHFSEGCVNLRANFRWKETLPTNFCWCQKTTLCLKKFPPLNSLQLCQILKDFKTFCITEKHIKFATKPNIIHFNVGRFQYYLGKLNRQILVYMQQTWIKMQTNYISSSPL